MKFKRIKYAVESGVAWIVLDRPEKLNALDKTAWEELKQAFSKASRDDSVKCVVFTGSGRAFSSGDDIKEMYSLESKREAEAFFKEVIGEAILEILNCEKPIVMAVNGLAYGGGFEILLLADIVIAREDAQFSTPEIKLGLIPPLMASLGPLTIGLKRALTLSLTSKRLTAREALKIGIVDYVVSRREFEEFIRETCKQLVSLSEPALKSLKKLFNEWKKKFLTLKPLEELAALAVSREARANMERFLEKRL